MFPGAKVLHDHLQVCVEATTAVRVIEKTKRAGMCIHCGKAVTASDYLDDDGTGRQDYLYCLQYRNYCFAVARNCHGPSPKEYRPDA